MAGGVVIPIEGDASGLDAAIDRASAAIRQLGSVAASVASGGVRRLQSETDAAGRAARTAATDLDRYKDAAYALNKAANAAGGALTFLTGPLEDVGDLLERGGGRMAALSLAAVGVVGGMYAVGRAAVAAGQALYDTAANASDLIEELESAGRSILPAHRDALLEAESATRGLDGAMLDLQLTLAATLAPTLTDTVDTVSGLTSGIQSVITEMGKWSTEIDATFDALSPMYRTVSLLVTGLGALIGVTAEAGREARKQAEATTETAKANAEWMKALEEHFKKEDEVTKGTVAHTAAIRDQTAAKKEAAGLTLTMDDVGTDGVIQSSSALTEIASTMGTIVEESRFLNLEFASAFNTASAELDALPEKLGRTREEWNAYYDSLHQRAAAWGANAKAVSASVFQVVADLAEKRTDSERKAARKRAIIMKAAAITEATINTFVATTKALASSSPPINFVLAGLTAAFGAVQIGLIASKPLVYHRGGMLDPDEERLNATSAVVRKNESIGVVTSQGRAAVDTAMSRLNAGQVSTGDTYLLIEGDVFRTRRVAGPDAGYGRSGRR